MKKIILSLSLLLLCACSHTLKFAANHFVVPVTPETQWGGHVSLGIVGVTNVAVMDDYTTNPPTRSQVRINETIDVADALYVSKVALSGGLSFYDGVEAFVDSSTWGLRWQFLNHNQNPDEWVAAVQAGLNNSTQTSEFTSNGGAVDRAESKIKSRQFGASVGYKFNSGAVPYLSYVHTTHEVETTVSDNNASFGPYTDKGQHQTVALGVTTYRRGVHYALEYAFNQIDWDRSDVANQGSLAGTIGFGW